MLGKSLAICTNIFKSSLQATMMKMLSFHCLRVQNLGSTAYESFTSLNLFWYQPRSVSTCDAAQEKQSSCSNSRTQKDEMS